MGDRPGTLNAARHALLPGALTAVLLCLLFVSSGEAVNMSLDKAIYTVPAGSTAPAILSCSGCNLPGAQLIISTGSTAIATVSPTLVTPTETPLNLDLTLTGITAAQTSLTVSLYQDLTLVASVFSSVNVVGGCPAVTALDGVSNADSKLATLREFRDHVLAKTPKGREYTRLFYQHAGEVSWLLLRHPDLRAQVRGVLEKLLPTIEAAVAEQRLRIQAADLDEIDEVVNALDARGSPALRQTIQRVWPEVLDLVR